MARSLCFFVFSLITPLGASPASSSSLTFCESPAVCTEAVCLPLEEPRERALACASLSSPGELAYREMKRLCPPDRDDIGHAMWTVLHSTAAHYPEKAIESQRRAAREFVAALPELYPCKDCARHLARALDEMPPRLATREDFSVWVCELHNRVSARTGKAPRRCVLRELDEAWRTPSQACVDARERLHAVTALAAMDR
jgi:FAD-linked sulfhydryl oxidase